MCFVEMALAASSYIYHSHSNKGISLINAVIFTLYLNVSTHVMCGCPTLLCAMLALINAPPRHECYFPCSN